MPTQLTPHFTLEELLCKCGKCTPPAPVVANLKRLAPVLEKIRIALGKPVIVNSGYRCPHRNAEAGGVADSQHVKGTAADLTIAGVSPGRIAEEAGKIAQVGGIGVYPYQGFCHVDIRPRVGGQITRWNG